MDIVSGSRSGDVVPDGALWVTEDQPPDMTAMRSADRKGGPYRRYYLTPLDNQMSRYVTAEVMEQVADVSIAVARIGQRLREQPMPILYATLMRNEAISSSWVEGLRETPRNIMVAQLKDHDPGLDGYQFEHLHTAQDILGNIDSMQRGVRSLRDVWTPALVHDIHHLIAPRVSDGWRVDDVQIGGSSKITAAYVAPPASHVPNLMANLLDYANHSGDNPLVKVAVIHAQFETIHPYEDGNGRTGRVLVHGYLARAGLIDEGVLPLSIILRRDTDEYVARLTAFRHGDPDQRRTAVSGFVSYFAETLARSCEETGKVIALTRAVADDWAARTARFRADCKVRDAVGLIAQQPVVTARYLASALGTSSVTAHTVINNLVGAGILQEAGGRFKRSEVYQAPAILAMMDRYVPGIQPTPLPRPVISPE